MTTHCPVCDRPRIRPEDWTPADDCEAHRVNWRERALEAEAVIASVRAEAERFAAAECDDSIDPRVDPGVAFAEGAAAAGQTVLALLPKEPTP